jgi:hypothetical protein
MPHVVRGDDGHSVRVGEIGEPPHRARAGAIAMMVHVDGEPSRKEVAPGARGAPAPLDVGERPFVAAGETEEPFGVRFDLIPGDAAVPLRAPERAHREEPAEVRVPDAVLDEQMQRARVLHDDVRADDRAHARRLRRLEEPRRAVEPVPIRERDRVVPELRARATRSSGSDAPARKENALRQRSST